MGKGGGSSGGQSSTTQVIQKADPWSGVQPYLKNLYASTDKLYGGQGQQYFPYQTYAQQSPLSDVGQRAMLGYANNYLPSLVNAGTQGMASQLGAVDVANNPYVQQMLNQQISGMTNAFGQQADTITRNLTQNWLPSIRSGAGLAGQYGGSRQGVAEGVAIGEASRALGDYASNAQQALGQNIAQTQLGAYGQGLDAQKAALALLPQQAQLGMLPAQLYGQVGASQEGYNTQAIQDAIQRFNFAQSEPYNRGTWYNSILTGAAPYASQTQNSTTTTDAGSGSTFGNVLGGGLTGYSVGSALGTAMGTSAPTMLGMGLGPWGAIAGALLGGLFG